MVLVKSAACVLLVFLCAAWLSTARLHPAGAEVNDISAMKVSVAACTINSTKAKGLAAIDGNLKRLRKCCNYAKSGSSVESKRRFRSRLSDEGDGGFVAFTADYSSPRHHPPKNNK